MKRYRIPELAEKYVKYDMIQTHTELPEMSHPRLQLLFVFLNQHPTLTKHSELYTLVISLMQLGLDTHDLIDTNTEHLNEKAMRSRQLNVLAGDYYSARFYQLLAKAGQIDMIANISNAVSEVNRIKVNLYTRMRQLKVTADDYLSYMVLIRSTLFKAFGNMLEGTMLGLWSKLLDEVSHCEIVLDEIERSESPARFDKSWAYWHVMQVGSDEERHELLQMVYEPTYIQNLVKKYKVRDLLKLKLRQSKDAIKLTADTLESDNLSSELVQIVDTLTNKMSGIIPTLNETR